MAIAAGGWPVLELERGEQSPAVDWNRWGHRPGQDAQCQGVILAYPEKTVRCGTKRNAANGTAAPKEKEWASIFGPTSTIHSGGWRELLGKPNLVKETGRPIPAGL
jgi:hypothetical protein